MTTHGENSNRALNSSEPRAGEARDRTVPLGKPGPVSLGLVKRFLDTSVGHEPVQQLSTVPSPHRPYAWELIEHRLTGLNSTPGCSRWDCWPVTPVTDHRSALACWNFIQSGLPRHQYDQVALFLPAEAISALDQAMVPSSRRKSGATTLPDGLLFLHRESDLREGLYLEAATPEAMFLCLHPLNRVWPLEDTVDTKRTKRKRERDPTAFSSGLSLPQELLRFPPADGFVLWLDAWCTTLHKAAHLAASHAHASEGGPAHLGSFSVPLDALVPLLNQRVLFVTPLSVFHHCLIRMNIGFAAPKGQEAELACTLGQQKGESDRNPSSAQPIPPPVTSLRFARAQRDQQTANPFTVSRPTNRSQSELSAFPPALLHHFLNLAQAQPSEDPDSLLALTLQKAFQSCCVHYEKWTQVRVQTTQLTTTFRYLNKWLAAQLGLAPGRSKAGALLPRSFDLLVATRACIDGNFSFELARLLEHTEQRQGQWSLPERDIRLSDLFPDTVSLRLESFATFEHFRQSLRPPRLRGLSHRTQRSQTAKTPCAGAEEDFADNSWLTDESQRHCSFPDEDIFLDAAVAGIQSDVKARVREQANQIQELTTSLEDGLDLRETLRNWHKGSIMVRAQTPATLRKVGAVVLVFDEESSDPKRKHEQKKYPWRALWHAEQHDATHLMFFATDFREQLIGPGIAVSEFGGFAALPAERWVVDLWDHPYLASVAHSDAEHLLLAAGFASPEGIVVHIAPRAPREEIRALLNRNRRPVVHIPLSTIERNKIRKLKTFHILADASVRNYAHKYIRKDHL